MRICNQRSLGVFQDLNGKVTGDGREILKEDLEGVTSLKMLKEDSDRHSRTDEHRGTAHDLRVGDDAGGLHGALLTGTRREFTPRTQRALAVAA
jgi:hypothetical protein